MLRFWGAAMALLLGCRGTPPGGTVQQEDIARLVDSLRPAVERASGLSFRGPTKSAMRTREQVREYLVARLQEDFPPSREEGVAAVYRLLWLIPDTLDLRALLLDLYTEQVAGFYDPMSGTLYGVQGADPAQLRLVLAHELVHALQHQYLPLDSIMRMQQESDRQSAAQAVFEGQATLASIRVLLPGQDLAAQPEFWQTFREQIKAQQTSMQVFARAPLAIREGLIFPYLNGAEFMRWWDSARAGTPLPELSALPSSTEQVLHPDRYHAGDHPVPVRFADSTSDLLYEDTFGELEIQVLATVLRGGGEMLTGAAIGWGGDRFRVYRSEAGPALVWHTAWDDAASADRFRGGIGARLLGRDRAGYRVRVEALPEVVRPMVRVVIAPAAWSRWAHLPGVRKP